MPARRDAIRADALPIDGLTPAVVEIRRSLAQVEAGKPTAQASDRELGLRSARCAGMHSRLLIVGHSRYAKHPLLDEAVRMRARLAEIEMEADAEMLARAEAEMLLRQRQHAARIRTG